MLCGLYIVLHAADRITNKKTIGELFMIAACGSFEDTTILIPLARVSGKKMTT